VSRHKQAGKGSLERRLRRRKAEPAASCRSGRRSGDEAGHCSPAIIFAAETPTALQRHVDRRRLLVQFKQAHVVARNPRLKREFFLRQVFGQPCFSDFLSKHGERLLIDDRDVFTL